MTPDQMQAGSPEFEQALAELAQLLQAAQQQKPRQMTDDQLAANVSRNLPGINGIPQNFDLLRPVGMDALGRKQTVVQDRTPTPSEMLGTAVFGDKQNSPMVNELSRTVIGQHLPSVVNGMVDLGRDTYDQTFVKPKEALREAGSDPSIANLTNAGVRTALALSPIKAGPALKTAATIGGLGLTSALGTDAFNALTSQPVEAADNDPVASIDKRVREIQAELAKKPASAVRRTLEAEANQLAQTKAAILTKSATTGIESEAATKRDTELRQNRAREIYDTSMTDYENSRKPGQALQTINKLGPIAPAVAAMIGGGITRLARPEASKTAQYVAGVLPAFTVANAKPAEAYMNEPIENPEVTAYKKAGRVLADTDPLKAQFKNELNSLPPTNPLREAAASDLTDWRKQAVRVPIAALEGTGAFLGNDLVAGLARMRKAPADIARTVGEIPGALKEGYNRGMQRANAVNQTAQPQLSPQHQELVADAWLTRNNPNNVIPGQQGFRTQAEMRAYALQQLGVNQQQPQAPTPGPSITNRLATIAKNAALPAAGVGAGYGLTKLFGQ